MNGEEGKNPKLVVLTGKKRGEELQLTTDGATIGRTKDADLVVKDKSISRRHAQFRREGGGWVVRDLESKNGVRVNNREISEQGLRTGDVVMLGGVKMKFIDPMELAPLPEPSPSAPLPLHPTPPPEQAPPLPGVQPSAPPVPNPPQAPPPQAPAPPPIPAFEGGGMAQQAQASPPAPANARGDVYSPQLKGGEEYAPPPEFFAPQIADAPKKAQRPLTRSMIGIFLVVFGGIGLGLGYLVWDTFFNVYEPFREDVKLAVREVRLFDMIRHAGLIRSAFIRVKESRVAQAVYDPKMAVLTVEGRALGDTDILFLGEDGAELGTVRVHILRGEKKKYVDRTAYTVDQLQAQAKELMNEGDSLGKAHLAEAIRRYEEAVERLEWVQAPQVKAMANMKLTELNHARDAKFKDLVDRYRQANKLGELRKAMDLLDDITKLYPEPSNIEHQRAKIFKRRIVNRQKALRAQNQ
jgi:pSer/pThr/pTyr-binding forkhead associated (FHA) protein